MSKLLFKKRFTEKRQFLTFWGFHRDNAKADHSVVQELVTHINKNEPGQIVDF